MVYGYIRSCDGCLSAEVQRGIIGEDCKREGLVVEGWVDRDDCVSAEDDERAFKKQLKRLKRGDILKRVGLMIQTVECS